MVNARFLPRWIAILMVLFVILGIVGQSRPVAAQSPKPAATPSDLQTLPFDVPDSAPMDVTTLSPDIPLVAPSILPELESNNTPATANLLSGTQQWARGTIGVVGDVDYYRFSAQAGDRVYFATHTLSQVTASSDTLLTLFGTDGTTVLEIDDDDGVVSDVASAIAGTVLATTGTYYLRVQHFDNTVTIDRYDLFFRLQSGTPPTETEPNNSSATANPLGANGWVAGSFSSATDFDYYAFNLNAGDSIYLTVDWDPARSGALGYDGGLYFGPYFDQGVSTVLFANDISTARPNADAFFIRVRNAGTYFAAVDRDTVGTGPFTYQLSATVFPAQAQTCTTYTSTAVPITIGPAVGNYDSALTVAGAPAVVTDINVTMNLTHTRMVDIDATLIPPVGASLALFSDLGNTTAGVVDTLNVTLDNEAPLAYGFNLDVVGFTLQPESPARLTAFNGINPNGVWTLRLADDQAAQGGRLSSWSIELCSAPLAVTLASFEATPRERDIQVMWESAQETDLLGYNLLRGDAPDGELTRLNDELILSQSPGGGQGASYEWIDSVVTQGSTYFYYLEAVNMDGSSQRFGPVSATFNAPTAVTLATFHSPHDRTLLWGVAGGLLMLVGVGVVLRRR